MKTIQIQVIVLTITAGVLMAGGIATGYWLHANAPSAARGDQHTPTAEALAGA